MTLQMESLQNSDCMHPAQKRCFKNNETDVTFGGKREEQFKRLHRRFKCPTGLWPRRWSRAIQTSAETAAHWAEKEENANLCHITKNICSFHCWYQQLVSIGTNRPRRWLLGSCRITPFMEVASPLLDNGWHSDD